MTLQQVKYIVAALALVQLVVVLIAIFLIIINIVRGIKQRDKSKYRKALLVFVVAFGLVFAVGVIQFFVLLE
jgi:uncharacterized membrane protein